MSADQRDCIGRGGIALVENKDFAELFTPGSRAEVPIVGKLSEGVLVSGQVDRLSVTKDQVLIADFKTDRTPPRRIEEVPDSLRRAARGLSRRAAKALPRQTRSRRAHLDRRS